MLSRGRTRMRLPYSSTKHDSDRLFLFDCTTPAAGLDGGAKGSNPMSSRSARSTAPWIFWPVAAVLDLIAFCLRLTGRFVGFAIGLVLLVIGGILTLTIVLAPIGIPILIIGLLVIIRALF
jgi:hypothetical protein